MIYLGFPYGSNFGWGVLGKEVALAMARRAEVRVLAPAGADQRLDDEFDRYRMSSLVCEAGWQPAPRGADCQPASGSAAGWRPAPQETASWKLAPQGQVIQAAIGRSLEPFVPGLGAAAVGYAVFEERILPRAVVARAREQYRHLAAGSSYCAEVLRQHGLSAVSVVPHGVDSELFAPRTAERCGVRSHAERGHERSFLTDRFIIFSGGKFELRKGQDIVIRAYKVLQDRHADVMLVNSWHNNWPQTRDTMTASPYIRYLPFQGDNYIAGMNGLLAANGIDLKRVITVGPRDHRLLPSLYHATDLGIFPNRVEGGNNMVLMEYLACGKPALVSYNSGHKDIVRRNNAVLIESHRPMHRHAGEELVAVWHDPSLEETIEKLEWCYQHREQLAPLARQAAADMHEFSWDHLAAALLTLAG